MPRNPRAAMSRASVPAALVLSLLATSALAQAAPPPPARPAEATVADVVVTAERPTQRSAIDRKIYTVSRDLAAANGSVSDVLRNLPSVEVDIDGNVSVRGDASVQILVDGQPSVLFSGSNRAQALQAMPARTVDTIEVMTNPSAEFAPDGTGGIINIVTKKVTKPGRTGSVQAGAGDGGRWSAGVLGAHAAAPLTLNASLSLRRDGRGSAGRSIGVQTGPGSGQRTEIAQISETQYHQLSFNGSASLDYDATPRDRLSVSGVLAHLEGARRTIASEVREDPGGVVLSEYALAGRDAYGFTSAQGSATWRHSFSEKGRLFTLTARRSAVSEYAAPLTDYVFSDPGRSRTEQRDIFSRQTRNSLAAAYSHPLADGGTFKAGYDGSREAVLMDVGGVLLQPDGSQLPMADVINRFNYVQANHQIYATWQKPLGKLTALAGLRLEHAAIDYTQEIGHFAGGSDYVDMHPSLHLQYALTEAQKLTVSYSHRVGRPSSNQLNPFVSFSDPFTASSGNPALRPQETHSLEAEWERTGDIATLSAAVFVRRNENTIGDVARFLSPGVVLNTLENQGTSTNGGLALTGTGKIGSQLFLRLSGNIAYNQLERPSTEGAQLRSGYGYSVRASLDWQPTEVDLLQFTGNYGGRQLTARGYRLPSGVLNLGYRRKLAPDLVMTATVSDIFETGRRISVVDTGLIYDRSERTGSGRLFTVGLTRQLGGRPARDPAFEYLD